MILIVLSLLGCSGKSKREIAIEKHGEEAVKEFEELAVGDTYTFGRYEQDGNLKNGKEGIQWRVLVKEDYNKEENNGYN